MLAGNIDNWKHNKHVYLDPTCVQTTKDTRFLAFQNAAVSKKWILGNGVAALAAPFFLAFLKIGNFCGWGGQAQACESEQGFGMDQVTWACGSRMHFPR